MGIKESPNRVVRTVDSVIAFIGHGRQTDEDILIECLVNSASNEVSWRSSSKARYGKDFVEANEDVQVLIDFANQTTDAQREAGIRPVTDQPIFNEDNLELVDEADTNADGVLSDKEKKRWNKAHPEDQR